MNEFEVERLVTKENLKNSRLVLFVTAGGFAHDTNDAIVSVFIQPYKKGVYFTVDYPAGVISKRLGGDVSKKLFFADAVTEKLNSWKIKDAVYIKDSASLAELSSVITELLDSGKFKFFFSSSLQAMLVDREEKEVLSFVNYLTNKLKQHGIKAAYSLKASANDPIKELLAKNCDKVVYLRS